MRLESQVFLFYYEHRACDAFGRYIFLLLSFFYILNNNVRLKYLYGTTNGDHSYHNDEQGTGYESPLGTRSFMRHIATQDFPVSPELTRDHFHTVFPLLSLGHVLSLFLHTSNFHCHSDCRPYICIKGFLLRILLITSPSRISLE